MKWLFSVPSSLLGMFVLINFEAAMALFERIRVVVLWVGMTPPGTA